MSLESWEVIIMGGIFDLHRSLKNYLKQCAKCLETSCFTAFKLQGPILGDLFPACFKVVLGNCCLRHLPKVSGFLDPVPVPLLLSQLSGHAQPGRQQVAPLLGSLIPM